MVRDSKLLESIDNDRESLLAMVGNEDQLQEVITLLAQEGITEKAYAQVFRLLFWKLVDPRERISYSVEAKTWYRGKETLSDMELVAVFSEAVYFIRKCVDMSWKICSYNTISDMWLNEKESAKTDLAMDSMESFAKLRLCLRQAAAIMPLNEPDTACVDWETICGDESDEGEEGEEPSPAEEDSIALD